MVALPVWARPLAVRKINYYGKTARNVTHYRQTVEAQHAHRDDQRSGGQ
jgi:xanthine dehydrogenase molybdopterin-binding subunit B